MTGDLLLVRTMFFLQSKSFRFLYLALSKALLPYEFVPWSAVGDFCFGHGFRYLLSIADVSNKAGPSFLACIFYTIQSWERSSPLGLREEHYELHMLHVTSGHTKSDPAELNETQVLALLLQFCCPTMSGWRLYGMYRMQAGTQIQPSRGQFPSPTHTQQWGLRCSCCLHSHLKPQAREHTGNLKLGVGLCLQQGKAV